MPTPTKARAPKKPGSKKAARAVITLTTPSKTVITLTTLASPLKKASAKKK